MADRQALSESQSKALLASYGLPLPKEHVVDTVQDAVSAAIDMEGAVALKADSPGLAHKTEAGLVALNLFDREAVVEAAGHILKAAPPNSRLLVQEMVDGKRELICGMTRDAQWGPVISLGIGGIFAEALDDVALRLAPVSKSDVKSMVTDLRSADLLGEYRGMTYIDENVLANLLIGLSQCALDRPDVLEIDVNPLIVTENGRLFAVDALVVTDSS